MRKNKYSYKSIISPFFEITKFIVVRQILGGAYNMPKYNQETKDKAVALAKQGVPLKEIQRQVGPNPKAIQRYLAKQGIEYKDLRVQLKDDGKLQPNQKKNSAIPPKTGSKKPTVKVVEE